MNKSIPATIFGFATLALGTAAMCFPHEIRSAILKVTRGKTKIWYAPFKVSPSQEIRDMRLSGAVGILMGLFVLWLVWKNY